ncbi:hypothetical protein DFH07DRAFT_865048 [Mycena maculata]|uniref:Core-binding (CB) domain-containing protein n=1 Tax=Mycena maculata TaxID=230809 RepID=A0AAD7KCU1_9AGAR|nr:hypothetical protein DFH07DRAFT_865048 [Mycena maculata]
MPPSNLSMHNVIWNAWAPATLDKYDNSLAHFLSYCDKMEVPTSFRLPASEFLLCTFSASFAGSLASSTIENKLNRVCAWHIINNVEYKGSLRLNYVMKGIGNLAPDALPPRPPITLDMLRLLYNHLDLSSPFDAAVFCAAVVAFWCQCRLGELFSMTKRSFNPKLIPSVSDLAPPCTAAGSRLLCLPCTKTKQTWGESTFLSKQKGFSDPVDAVDHHLSANQLQASDPLFSYCTANGVWGSFALPRSTRHCFRIGGTTELLLVGVPPDIVKMMGRWSSDSFLRYWHSLHCIAPLHSKLLDI